MTLRRVFIGIAIAAYAVASVAYGVHAYNTNPQYDNQGMWNAQEAIIAASTGQFGSFVFEERKYPLLYSAPFAIAYEGLMISTNGSFTDPSLFLLSRIISLLFILGTFLALWRIGTRLPNGIDATLLLMTSILFILFGSAIRPHMAVACLTMLSLLCSIRVRERPTILRTVSAFGCAMLAFCSLQSGIFAFIFPLWAILPRRFNVRRTAIAGLWTLAFLALAIPLGYPFLLRPLIGLSSTGGIDLGHDVGLHFAVLQPWHIFLQLLGGEPILLAASALGLIAIVRARSLPHPLFAPVLMYVAIFSVVFAFHTSAAGRFFIPIFPMLGLIGSVALAEASRTPFIRPALAVFIILIAMRIGWLAMTPNTYQQVNAFFLTQPGRVASLSQPGYFFDIPQEKRVSFPEQYVDIHTVAVPDYSDEQAKVLSAWPICFRSVASRTTDEIVLLWNDTPWALWHLFEASRLGPNLTVYCSPSVAL